MRKLTTLFFLLFSIATFAQNNAELKEWVAQADKGETPAIFPKGTEVFKKMIVDNFRMKKIKSDVDLSCKLTFIIDQRGKMTDVRAEGSDLDFNSEAVRALSKIKTKWKPAEIRGRKVRYLFRIPLNIKFE